MSRGSFALKIRPKFGLPKMRFGRSKFARLKRLKTSHRNSSSDVPCKCHVFASEKSTFANPGPSTLLRGALPNVNGACSAKQFVLNHCAGACGALAFGSHV